MTFVFCSDQFFFRSGNFLGLVLSNYSRKVQLLTSQNIFLHRKMPRQKLHCPKTKRQHKKRSSRPLSRSPPLPLYSSLAAEAICQPPVLETLELFLPGVKNVLCRLSRDFWFVCGRLRKVYALPADTKSKHPLCSLVSPEIVVNETKTSRSVCIKYKIDKLMWSSTEDPGTIMKELQPVG